MRDILRGLFHRTRLIDRYIIWEVTGPFVLGMFALIIIGMVDLVFTLVDMFINNGVPFPIVFKILVFKIPAIMVLFFPMAVLFAVSLTLIRMIKDSEFTVLRASGISLWRVIAPIIFASVLASMLSFANNDFLTPWANSISDDLIDKAVMKKPVPEILENTFFRESDARYFYIRRIDKQTNTLENVSIFETTGNFPRVITARQAFWDGAQWLLKTGIIHNYDEHGALSYQGNFEDMKIHIDQGFFNYYKSQKSPMEMSSKELRNKIQTLREGGVQSLVEEVAYHMKYSQPVACLIFALVGLALLLLFMGNGRDLWGVIVAVMLALMSVGFYFTLTAVFRSYGRGGMLSPDLAAWGPNIIYGVLALAIIIIQNRRR